MPEMTALAHAVAGSSSAALAPAPVAAVHGPFPRAVPTFVGRAEELARAQGLIGRAALVLVYGVPGIGKTEFVYRLMEELRTDARWRRAQQILVRAQPGQRVEHVVSLLRFAASDGRRARGPAVQYAGREDDLAAVASALDRRPYLIFLDDAHHIEPGALADVLSYLSRRAAGSRILVAARAEILLGDDTPSPVIIRLPPLSAAETGALAEQLAEGLGLAPPPSPEIHRQSSGCPHQIQRALLRARGLPARGEDALAETVRTLSPQARHVLSLCRLTEGRLGAASALATELQSDTALQSALWELAQRFLIDVPRCTVHDLVWDAAARVLTADELRAAHRHAAQLYAQRAAAPGGPGLDPVDALARIQHLLQAGDAPAAWAALERSHRQLAAAGLDHLTLDALAALRTALPDLREAITLRTARVLLRRSCVEQAQAELAGLSADASCRASARFLRIAGQVAQRAGQLDRAAALLHDARAAADTPHERLHAALHLAGARALTGDGDEARRVLDEAGPPDALARHERGRYGWARAVCALFSDDPGAAAWTARAAAERLREPPPLPDCEGLESSLAVLETVARCLCDELPAARRALDVVLFRTAAAGVLRAQFAELCRGVVLFTEGAPGPARLSLLRAQADFAAHHDQVPAILAGLYLGACALTTGDAEEALAQLSLAAEQAARAGGRGLHAVAEALRARALLATLRVPEALAAARALTADPAQSPRARVLAGYALWRIHAFGGDLEAAAQVLAAAGEAAQAAGGPALLWDHALEHAERTALFGDPSEALERAEPVRAYYAQRGCRHATARAELAQAVAYARRGTPDDTPRAAEVLERIVEAGTAGGYAPILLGATVVSAALAQRRGDTRRARETLTQGLADNSSAGGVFAALPLHAALTGWAASGSLAAVGPSSAVFGPGLRRLLADLGLYTAESPPLELADRGGRRTLRPDTAAQERTRYDLCVDLARSEIHAREPGRCIAGRPLMCALLARLLAAGPEGVDAERLFYDVWAGKAYHPLQHRNTIHVALTRLRQALRELLPGREIIATAPGGWRLLPDVALCVLSAPP